MNNRNTDRRRYHDELMGAVDAKSGVADEKAIRRTSMKHMRHPLLLSDPFAAVDQSARLPKAMIERTTRVHHPQLHLRLELIGCRHSTRFRLVD